VKGVSVDVEPDSVVYLKHSSKGLDEALPRLLELLGYPSAPTGSFILGVHARKDPGCDRRAGENGSQTPPSRFKPGVLVNYGRGPYRPTRDEVTAGLRSPQLTQGRAGDIAWWDWL